MIFIRPVVVRDASLDTELADYRRYLPSDAFFRDTRPPLPALQHELERIEQGNAPRGSPNPVVPDPAAPSPGGQT